MRINARSVAPFFPRLATGNGIARNAGKGFASVMALLPPKALKTPVRGGDYPRALRTTPMIARRGYTERAKVFKACALGSVTV